MRPDSYKKRRNFIKSFGYLKNMLNFALANEEVERFSKSEQK